MGLVDYGSDSDSDSGSPPPPAAAALPKSASTSTASLSSALPKPKHTLSLPPPTASSSSLTLPPPTNGATTSTAAPGKMAAKKTKGPVRIMLDLPPPTADTTAEDLPPAKKPKLTLGSGTGGKLTGLAAMLPAPKNEAPAPKPAQPLSQVARPAPSAPAGMEGLDSLLGELEGREEKVGMKQAEGLFVPYRMSKGKKPAAAKETVAPAPAADPGLDFFGIGSVPSTSSAPSTSSRSHLPSISSAPGLSSAPTPAAPASSSAPAAADPYPGFTQLPNGQWVAKTQEAYDAWVAQVGVDGQGPASAVDELPRGFGASAVAGAVSVDDEARTRRQAWEQRPEAVAAKEAEEKKGFKIVGHKKVAQGRARRTGQLSALLADAVERRAELEEKIARGKANRQAAGNKYGF